MALSPPLLVYLRVTSTPRRARRPSHSQHLCAALLLLAPLLLAANPAPTGAATPRNAGPYPGYWHTSGTSILDSTGQIVRIAGVTWYGMESSHWVPAGLDFQPYTTIMDLIKLLGYNTVRLPFSNELVERNPVVRDAVRANPQFQGKRAMEVMDAIAGYAQRIGLKIILDDHRSRASRPMGINSLDEPLWYTKQFSDAAWVRDWEALARRYRGNDAVVAFDLRNEPHTAPPGPWTVNAYLHQGATWGPYRGVSNPATDWRPAAERAGNAALAVNPHLLMVVEGLQLYPDSSRPGGVVSSWWAGVLTPVKAYPVTFQVAHQLVYSVHEYGPRKFRMPWYTHMTYRSLANAWHGLWSFLLDDPTAPYAAPLLLGEFGTCNDDPQCIDALKPDNQASWLQNLLRFLREHPGVGWGFFALDGTNANNCATDNGILNWKWNAVSSGRLQADLTSAQPSPGFQPATGQPIFPGTAPRSTPRSTHSPLCQLP